MNTPCPPPAYSYIIKALEKDILAACASAPQGLSPLRAKDGVHIFKGCLEGRHAVFKFFEKEEHRREMENYRILQGLEIPTIRTFALGEKAMAMEDIEFSGEWRLGAPGDLQNGGAARALARWYFQLHEKGGDAPELGDLYCEYDDVSGENIAELCQKLPGAAKTFEYILKNHGRLRELISAPAFTLTYNDFYWTNLALRKNGRAAIMFDYNLLGKGHRYSDIRNVQSSLSGDAGAAFKGEYDSLYISRHGSSRSSAKQLEKELDDVVSCLFTLITAFKRERFPAWASEAREEALSGALLQRAKKLLEGLPR